MTLSANGVQITAREMGWIAAVVSLVGSGFYAGITFHALRQEVQLMRSDICEFAIPPERRPFAYSCHDLSTGLQAQEPR